MLLSDGEVTLELDAAEDGDGDRASVITDMMLGVSSPGQDSSAFDRIPLPLPRSRHLRALDLWGPEINVGHSLEVEYKTSHTASELRCFIPSLLFIFQIIIEG